MISFVVESIGSGAGISINSGPFSIFLNCQIQNQMLVINCWTSQMLKIQCIQRNEVVELFGVGSELWIYQMARITTVRRLRSDNKKSSMTQFSTLVFPAEIFSCFYEFLPCNYLVTLTLNVQLIHYWKSYWHDKTLKGDGLCDGKCYQLLSKMMPLQP